jgi:signal transduction histidine kinase/ActR/RegA family two-component response regulator
MKIAKKPVNETERILTLQDLEILDTESEKVFDDLTQLASEYFNVPIVLISLVDEERQWFKSKQGLGACETPRDFAFCAHAILQDDLFIVENALEDERFADNPLVTDQPNVIFYAGYPIEIKEGIRIGTLCLIDNKPRKFSTEDRKKLITFGEQVEFLLKQRLQLIHMSIFSAMLEELHKLNSIESLDIDTLAESYLDVGMNVLNLDFGIISHVDGDDYEVLYAISPENVIEPGSHFELAGTYCEEVIKQGKTVFYREVGQIEKLKDHPVYVNMKLESYISTPIYILDKVIGTINFSSRDIRKRSFSPEEVKFLELLSQSYSYKYELDLKTKQLKESRKEALEAADAKAQFLANMSHEIRTPLNAIMGVTDLIKNTKLNDEQTKYVDIFKSSSQHLLQLINDILDLSKIDANKISLENRPLNLQKVISNLETIFDHSIREKGLDFEIHIDPTVNIHKNADETRINQILFNLVGNAIKFTKKGSIKIMVSSIQQENLGNTLISIIDTGIGIPKDKLEHIFDEFSQADASTTREYGGTGLGLAISKKLANLMGGDLKVESVEGSGSKFHILLNLEDMQQAEIECEEKVVNYQDYKDSANILIVDDNSVNRMIIKAYLKETNFSIEMAKDGEEAYNKLKDGHFDIVFMDIQMPKMNGLEVTQKYRQENKDSETIIYALSAFSGDEEAQKAIDAGCNGYISKPISKDNFTKVLNKILRKVAA